MIMHGVLKEASLAMTSRRIISDFYYFFHTANEELIKISSDGGCVCPGSILTYRCTAVGVGSTQWTGTALNCTNALIFRHSRFSSETISGQCNNGAVVGRSLDVTTDNCYVSELTVNISISLDNKTVQCIHNSQEGRNIIGTSSLTVLKGSSNRTIISG
jgi:hypothetical protein